VIGDSSPVTYSVTVSRNWRVTYRWDDKGPFDIDLEDYHGD
jgi:plasmid maintenance system killer protein